MKESKRTTHVLRCLLSDAEKIEAGRELAEATNMLTELDNDRKQYVDSIKAKVTVEESKIAAISNKVRSGYELREVDCIVFFDEPISGEKTTVRLDTNATVSVERMTQDECQRQLDLEAKEALDNAATDQ